MDGLLEDKLLDQYTRHIDEERSFAAREEEMRFLPGLRHELGNEFEENRAELEEGGNMRYGKKNKEFYRLIAKIERATLKNEYQSKAGVARA